MSNDLLRGTAELNVFLSALPNKIRTQIMRSALTAAAAPVREKARELAPHKTGALALSITTGSPSDNRDGTFSVRVRADPKKKGSYVGYFLEYGTDPHLITAGDSKYNLRTLNRRSKQGGISKRENGLVRVGGYEYTRRVATKEGDRYDVLKIGNHYVGGSVFHPGIAARPFMRPAIDQAKDEAIKAFAAKLREGIENRTGLNATQSVTE